MLEFSRKISSLAAVGTLFDGLWIFATLLILAMGEDVIARGLFGRLVIGTERVRLASGPTRVGSEAISGCSRLFRSKAGLSCDKTQVVVISKLGHQE